MEQEQMTVAFAMGGLAGNNAHGAGFLQAAIERGVEPLMISCTSGQILWVSRYLQIKNGQFEADLKEMLQKDIREINPTGNVNFALAALTLFGKPGVCVPAGFEYLRDLVDNFQDLWRHTSTKPDETLHAQKCLELFPCRYLIPDFPPEFFGKISEVFRQSTVGIVFNSYNPRSGKEHVYLNDRARELLHTKSRAGKQKYKPGNPSDYRDRTIYQDIDANAVRDGLWLYHYGFDRKESEFVDGAYFRGIILSELAVAHRIFCVRPINHCWIGDMPRNWLELEDLKAEIGFDGSYCGERYQIELVNHLLKKMNPATPSNYHYIDLQEIEMKEPQGYFDYLFESEKVFIDAYNETMQCFDQLGYLNRQ
jgi:hypothetical protein